MRRLWKTKLPAFLLAMVMVIGMMPAAGAASVSKTYDVDEDDSVYLDAEDFQKIYEDETDGDLEYIKFTDYDDFDDYGCFIARDFDNKKYNDIDYWDLDRYYFYYDEDKADSDDLDLDTLAFVTDDDIRSDSLDFTVKLYGDEKTVTATIRISIEGSDKDDGDITVEADADDEIELSAKSFKTFFDKKSDETFEYMYFTSIPSKMDNYGYFYSRNKNDKEVALDADDQIIGYQFVSLGKMTDFIKKGDDPNTAWEKAKGQYGRVADAVKIIDPRKE